MGVHGLWRLLDSFGTVVQPDDLKGKRVAIDASIWIAQFRARIAPGEDVEHMIVEGFLARILKLLFYGIKPVFVFDGQASSSKGAEHQRRMRQRAINEQAQLKRRAKQILMAQVAAGSINLEELRSAIAADTEASSGATAIQKNGGGNGAAGVETGSTNGSDAAAAGRESVGEKSQLKAAATTRLLHRSRHHGKRRRDKKKSADPDADHPPSHHHSNNQHRHVRRRTRRLAPDAVSARSTVHFLQDVEGLIEDRAKQEARVLHNALQHTSTSLFMGPRRAVEDDGAAQTETKAGTPLPPPSAVVIEDSVSRHNSHDEVISVTDGGEEEEEEEGEDASSSCCAVSSSTVSVAAEEDDDAVVQVQQRQRTSSQSPPNTNGATILHRNDLTRFLASLSQRVPAAATAAYTVAAAAAVAPQAHELEDVRKTEHDRSSGNSSGSTEHSAASRTMATAAVTVDTEDDIGDDDEEESSSSSCVESEASTGDEEAAGEEGSDTDSDSDTWSDDEEEEGEEENVGDPSDTAADLTWEPFTQRLTSLLPQSIAAVLQEDESPPSQGTPEPQDRHASDKADDDDDDDDYTPVKLDQPFSARPSTAMAAATTTSAAATVVVSSSEEDERSNSSALVAASSPAIAVVCGASAPASEAGGDTRITPLRVSDTPAVPRPAAARRTVAIIPFELLHIVELLECCGLPYVLSPAEADAQCAFLARHGLVDAVFTEDSDVLVHGATTVLRGFFSQSKSVVAYRQAELAACGITKTVLVALASLLGCDYTEGVQGIGLVGALEALVVAWTALENRDNSTESPLAARHVLRRWRDLVQRPPLTWHDVDDDMTVAQFALLRSAITQWHLLEQRPTFPERQPIEAFYTADVDDDVTPFTWLPPNWQQIRIFAGGLGALSSTWLVQRFELARRECLKREGEEAAAQERGQRRLTEFGARERMRAEWAFQKQPRRHAAVLSQLRAVQLLG